MGIKTDIGLLDMDFQASAAALLGKLREDPDWKDAGYRPIVVETRRDLPTQMAYYSRGRMEPKDVVAMFAAAGLWKLTDAEARKPTTWTLKSKHLEGKALDLAPSKNGYTPDWNAPRSIWERIGHYARELGLEWGGDWSATQDLPHVEVKE